MSFLSAFRRPPVAATSKTWCRAGPCRCISMTTSRATEIPVKAAGSTHTISSCPEGTVLDGLNWLKGQEPVTAQADDAYPTWLWKLLDQKSILDDGPGGKGEKVRLRKENRKRIRDTQFMKTQ